MRFEGAYFCKRLQIVLVLTKIVTLLTKVVIRLKLLN